MSQVLCLYNSFSSLRLGISLCFVVLCVVFSFDLAAQAQPRAIYNFDTSDLSEATSNYQTGTVQSNILFDCGVGFNSNALLMEGTNDTVSLDPNVKEILGDEFSISFYFMPMRNNSRSLSLLSIQENCQRDSSLNISYTTNDELRIEYAANSADALRFSYVVNTDFCWHHVVFSRDANTYTLYVDGRFIESVTFLIDIAMGKNFPVYVGHSDCVGSIENPFDGRIDDIRFYDTALDEDDIAALNFFPDRIVSQDTTLFEGDSYMINTGATCANTIQWTPAGSLDDPQSTIPIATPTESTTYTVKFDHDSCSSEDTVRVSIVKEDDIDCSNLLLPKAFTPNGDDLNDVFGISNKFIVNTLNRFEIFDRWGTKVFETIELLEEWDGSFRGQNALPGTYVYKIEYQCLDETFQKTGSFNLIK